MTTRDTAGMTDSVADFPEAGDVDFDENQNKIVYDGARWVAMEEPPEADPRARIRHDPN